MLLYYFISCVHCGCTKKCREVDHKSKNPTLRRCCTCITDVGEEGVDVPGQHGHHIGDDEGGRRPGHQQEGDEGHSLQEAKHLANAAERALRCARPGAGGLRAAWRRRPRRGQPRAERRGRRAPRRPGRPGAGGRASAKSGARRRAARRPGRGGWGAVGRGLLRNP